MMTKEQFDDEFRHGCCFVRADTMEEWFDLNKYISDDLGLEQSRCLLTHSCSEYPYVGLEPGNERVTAWPTTGLRSVLSFEEFQSVIYEDSIIDLHATELGDIL
nr:MAG TPA: hypothetical protein [Caudoviricetes sp.]